MANLAPEPNGYPTWKGVLLLMGAGIALALNVSWLLLHDHTASIHQNAVSYREFTEAINRIDSVSKEIRIDVNYLVRREQAETHKEQ